MKKLILSLVAALCIGGFSTTQAQVKFGVVGGLNVSKLSYERSKLFDSENRAGWFIGPKMWVKVPLKALGVGLGIVQNAAVGRDPRQAAAVGRQLGQVVRAAVLSGRRVQQLQKGGIYIQGGKKFIVK